MSFVVYPEVGQKYDHYKGGKYEIITLCEHSETKEKLVIYKSLLFGTVYARPLEQWFEQVTTPQGVKFRFQRAFEESSAFHNMLPPSVQ